VAFSEANKKNIRMYLGVPFGYYELTYRLESVMVLVGQNATDQAQVEVWLTRLAEIDTALTGSGSSTTTATYGSLKKVDEIEFYDIGDDYSSSGLSSIALVDQGRVLIKRIARAFGVSDILPIGDYFSARPSPSFAIQLG
jgi:hypothetical protein